MAYASTSVRLSSLSLALLAVPLEAQVPGSHALVATTAAGATLLLDVDLATGASAPFGAFPHAVFAPLAVAYDEADGGAVVALALAPNVSRLVRVGRSTGFERVLADIAGPVTALAFDAQGDVVVLVGGNAGGVLVVPRNGGAPLPRLTLAYAAALSMPGRTEFAWIVADPPGAGATLLGVDLHSGAVVYGPAAMPTPAGPTITGVADLPTGALRQVIADTGGGLALFEFGTQLRPLPVQPPWPGGISALDLGDGAALSALVLGDAAHPHLESIEVFGASPGTRVHVAGPLPGAPVGFARFRVGDAAAVRFGAPCALAAFPPSVSWSGAPSLGATITLSAHGAEPATLAILALGFDEQQWSLGPLPFALPGGCALLVAPVAGLAVPTTPAGFASVALSVSSQPSTVGLVACAQWVIGASLATSEAVALRVGP